MTLRAKNNSECVYISRCHRYIKLLIYPHFPRSQICDKPMDLETKGTPILFIPFHDVKVKVSLASVQSSPTSPINPIFLTLLTK